MEDNKILVLAPHTDDGELGMGGTISKLISNNNEIHYAAFSTADKSLPDEFPKDTLAVEVTNATKKLGIPKENLHVFPYEVRRFSYLRQEILDAIILLKKEINPDVVFCPTPKDLHQDHVVVANEAIRAFKKSNIFAYELPWNNLSFSTDMFFVLQEEHLMSKIKALGEYKSQASKKYMKESFIRSWANMRGVQIDVELAECFEVIRIIR